MSVLQKFKLWRTKLHIAYIKFKCYVDIYTHIPQHMLEIRKRVEHLSDEIQAFSDIVLNEKLDAYYMSHPEELKKLIDKTKGNA